MRPKVAINLIDKHLYFTPCVNPFQDAQRDLYIPLIQIDKTLRPHALMRPKVAINLISKHLYFTPCVNPFQDAQRKAIFGDAHWKLTVKGTK